MRDGFVFWSRLLREAFLFVPKLVLRSNYRVNTQCAHVLKRTDHRSVARPTHSLPRGGRTGRSNTSRGLAPDFQPHLLPREGRRAWSGL